MTTSESSESRSFEASSDRWYQRVVFEEIAVEAIRDSNRDGVGDFPGLTQMIPYFADRGVGCLWLKPFYPSGGADGGYDITEHRAIDSRYGTLDDFHIFLDTAHGRDIKVLVDFVPNHTSVQHPWFRASRRNPAGPYGDYYVWRDDDRGYPLLGRPFPDLVPSQWTWDRERRQFYLHRFFPSQPDLNFENPAVRREMLAVVRFWLERGVDGFRVDTPAALYEEEGTACDGLPATHDFFRRVRAMIDKEFPGAVLLAELCEHASRLPDYFDGQFHLSLDFPPMEFAYHSIATASAARLKEVLGATPAFPETSQTVHFMSNHAERNFALLGPVEQEQAIEFYGDGTRGERLFHGVASGFARMLDHHRPLMEAAYLIMFTQPGSPLLYYRDAVAMGDLTVEELERLGYAAVLDRSLARPDLRPLVRGPMQWTPSHNAGFSAAPPTELYLPVALDYRFNNVGTQRANPRSWLNFETWLIQMWRRTPAFGRGEFRLVGTSTAATVAWLRSWRGKRYLCAYNISGRPHGAVLDLGALRESGILGRLRRFPHHGILDLREGGVLGEIRSDRLELTFGPHGSYVAELAP